MSDEQPAASDLKPDRDRAAGGQCGRVEGRLAALRHHRQRCWANFVTGRLRPIFFNCSAPCVTMRRMMPRSNLMLSVCRLAVALQLVGCPYPHPKVTPAAGVDQARMEADLSTCQSEMEEYRRTAGKPCSDATVASATSGKGLALAVLLGPIGGLIHVATRDPLKECEVPGANEARNSDWANTRVADCMKAKGYTVEQAVSH